VSHWITAYTKSDKATDDPLEIATLERGAFNPLNRKIYEILDCVDGNYCGVSGCGTSKEFTLKNIQDALGDIDGEESFIPESNFLRDCINADDGSGFVIDFY
jgi:hypothetical protein